jgi:hypothetical protein
VPRKPKEPNDRKTRSNKIKGGNDEQNIKEIIDKVEKGETLTSNEKDNLFRDGHWEKYVIDEITERIEMYNHAIDVQRTKIPGISTQGDDDNDNTKKLKRNRKIIEMHTTTLGRLKDFAHDHQIEY